MNTLWIDEQERTEYCPIQYHVCSQLELNIDETTKVKCSPAIIAYKTLMPKWSNLETFQHPSIELLYAAVGDIIILHWKYRKH